MAREREKREAYVIRDRQTIKGTSASTNARRLLQPQGRVLPDKITKHLPQARIGSLTEIEYGLPTLQATHQPKIFGSFPRDNVAYVIEQSLRQPPAELRHGSVFDHDDKEP
jgi:hypothetical protein